MYYFSNITLCRSVRITKKLNRESLVCPEKQSVESLKNMTCYCDKIFHRSFVLEVRKYTIYELFNNKHGAITFDLFGCKFLSSLLLFKNLNNHENK